MTNTNLPPLPEKAFRLRWDDGQAAYKVSLPSIDSVDCFTADQMHAYALAAVEKATAELTDRLHGQIMNIPIRRTEQGFPMGYSPAYLDGHRDARHAAAELVATTGATK